MTENWEHQQLPRSDIDEMREEVKRAAQKMDEARRKLIEQEKRTDKDSKK